MPFTKISHINCLFGDSEGIRFIDEVIMCCYVRYVLKCAMKSALSIEIYVPCKCLAMCMDITETYDDMRGLRLILYMCKAEDTFR